LSSEGFEVVLSYAVFVSGRLFGATPQCAWSGGNVSKRIIIHKGCNKIQRE